MTQMKHTVYVDLMDVKTCVMTMIDTMTKTEENNEDLPEIIETKQNFQKMMKRF